MLNLLKDKRGFSGFFVFIITTGILLAVFYILVMAQKPFVVKADLENYTRLLTRKIEVTGAIDSDIAEYAAELAEVYHIDPNVTYDADYISGTKHIQIRDGFKVTTETNVEIVLLDGSFFKPVKISIPVADQKEGISEKLWK